MKSLTRGGRQIIAKIQDSSEVRCFIEQANGSQTQISTLHKDADTNLIHSRLTTPVHIPLDKDQVKHLVSVLRVKDGELIRVIDPETNIIGQGPLVSKDKKNYSVHIEVIGKSLSLYPNMLIGLPEIKTLEACIEKLTEIGIKKLYFFESEYSQTKSNGLNIERLLKKRDAAVKQSYSFCVPQIAVFDSLEKAVEMLQNEGSDFITFYSPKDKEELNLHDTKIHNIEWLFSYKSSQKNTPTLSVGPEGGFSRNELAYLIKQNTSFVSLGENTLRVETAATLAAACINSGVEN